MKKKSLVLTLGGNGYGQSAATAQTHGAQSLNCRAVCILLSLRMQLAATAGPLSVYGDAVSEAAAVRVGPE